MPEYGDGFSSLAEKMALCVRKGSELFDIFKFRPFPWGQEQSLRSLLEITGEPAPNYRKVKAYIENHKPEKRKKAEIALNYHYNSAWAYEAKSLMLDVRDGLSYARHLEHTVYRALFDMNLGVDFTYDFKNLSRYTGAHKKVIDKLRLRHLSDGVGKRDNGYSVKAEYPLFFCPCVEAIDLFTFFEYN